MTKERSDKATRRGLLMVLVPMALYVIVASGCCTGDCARDSGTTYARDALQKYVDSGEIPGAISVFYKDGVQETACIGYADVEACTNRLN